MGDRSRGTPRTLQELLDSQRTQWRQHCPSCGHSPHAPPEAQLRAQVRALEQKVRELEAQLKPQPP